MHTRGALGLLLAALSCSGVAHAQEYYRQNPINTGGGYSSQDARNPGGLGWFSEVADNFPGQSGWSINRVEFWGGYVADPATPGHTHGFTVRFYTDNNGHPGTRVYEQDVLTFTEQQYYLSPPIPPTWPNGYAGYHYTVDLPTPFTISEGGQFWLSVVAILDRGGVSNEPQWGWAQALTVTPPVAHQRFFSPTFTPNANNVDMSFVLSNAAPACVSDVDNGSGTGTPDGGVTIDDLLYYLVLFNTGDVRADVDDGSGTNHHDGGVTIEDLLYYIVRYSAGC